MKRFSLVSAVLLVALMGVSLPAGASAGAPAAGPQAHASKKCSSVRTRNGGRSSFLYVSGNLSCRRVRRVAARANGKRYMALGFDCKPTGKPSRFGRLYGCGGTVKGKVFGIGFYYKKG